MGWITNWRPEARAGAGSASIPELDQGLRLNRCAHRVSSVFSRRQPCWGEQNMAPSGVVAGIDLAGFATSTLVSAIKAIYHVAEDFNDWIDRHIGELKRSDRPVVACTGRVLEAAKFGFGLGYIASTVLIASGQMLLG